MVVGNINTEDKEIEIECYHGTTIENSKQIVENQYFLKSTKDNEWLGEGVYFFEDRSDAEWWTSHDRFGDEPTTILSCTIIYQESQLLDLDNREQLRAVRVLIGKFLYKAHKVGINMDGMNEYERQCFICNTIQKNNA